MSGALANQGPQLDSLGCSPFPQQADHVLDGVAELEIDELELELASLDLGEVQDVVDDG